MKKPATSLQMTGREFKPKPKEEKKSLKKSGRTFVPSHMRQDPIDDFDIFEGIENEEDIQILEANEENFEEAMGFDEQARDCKCCEGLVERCTCVNDMNLPMCYCAIDRQH